MINYSIELNLKITKFYIELNGSDIVDRNGSQNKIYLWIGFLSLLLSYVS